MKYIVIATALTIAACSNSNDGESTVQNDPDTPASVDSDTDQDPEQGTDQDTSQDDYNEHSSPIANGNIDAVLSGIHAVISNHPHISAGPVMTQFKMPENVPGLEVTVPQQVSDDNSRIPATITCLDGGSYESNPVGFTWSLEFDNCVFQGASYDGQVSTGSGGGSSPLGREKSVGYISLEIIHQSGDIQHIKGSAEHYSGLSNWFYYEEQNLENFSYDEEIGEALTTVSVDKLKVIDKTDEQPRTQFTADFTVTGSWTNQHTLNVSTTSVFTGADETGNYINGSMVVKDEIGNSLVLDADTGDAATYSVILTRDGTTVSEIRNWDEAFSLPCVSVGGDASLSNCTFMQPPD